MGSITDKYGTKTLKLYFTIHQQKTVTVRLKEKKFNI